MEPRILLGARSAERDDVPTDTAATPSPVNTPHSFISMEKGFDSMPIRKKPVPFRKSPDVIICILPNLSTKTPQKGVEMRAMKLDNPIIIPPIAVAFAGVI